MWNLQFKFSIDIGSCTYLCVLYNNCSTYDRFSGCVLNNTTNLKIATLLSMNGC